MRRTHHFMTKIFSQLHLDYNSEKLRFLVFKVKPGRFINSDSSPRCCPMKMKTNSYPLQLRESNFWSGGVLLKSIRLSSTQSSLRRMEIARLLMAAQWKVTCRRDVFFINHMQINTPLITRTELNDKEMDGRLENQNRVWRLNSRGWVMIPCETTIFILHVPQHVSSFFTKSIFTRPTLCNLIPLPRWISSRSAN